MNSDKKALREYFKKVRLSLSPDIRQAHSKKIIEQIQSLVDLQKVSEVHIYEPIVKLAEVDISSLSALIVKNYPLVKVSTSRKIDNKWRIISLRDNLIYPKTNFDLIIVPTIAFDKELHRLGYGGGYYDKFLSTQTEALKIGVSFESCKTDILPHEPHDVALDIIVTEKTVYRRPI